MGPGPFGTKIPNGSGAVLAARWGFFDAAHFSRVFRQHYGHPPSQRRPGAWPR